MVSDAAATKAPIAKIADKVSGVFVPAVISIAIVTTIVWLLIGQTFGFALARGISVLVISCPCALGLATPVAIMVGNGMGAKNGILFKTAASLEETGKMDIVALDKTGTITSGEPKVTDIVPAEGVSETELMDLALALEQKSEHPLARAIMQRGEELGMKAPEVSSFEALPGNGVIATMGGKELATGNHKFIVTKATVSDKMREKPPRPSPSRARPRCTSPTAASWPASSPWPTSSRRTARAPSASCRTWASASSCSPATTSAPRRPSAPRPASTRSSPASCPTARRALSASS